MSSIACAPGGQASVAAASLDSLFKSYDGPPFEIRFWDQTSWCTRAAEAAFAICLRTEGAWKALSRSPNDVALGTRYIDGEIEVDGDLYQVLRALPRIEQAVRESAAGMALAAREWVGGAAGRVGRLARWGTRHSERRDAASIAQHYDKPAEFYELFLGRTMVYSCAYFRGPEQTLGGTLDQAQTDKMDLICRKLGLARGERFLDIGCGWGSLVLHARDRYGARARGISLSREQVEYGRRRLAGGTSANGVSGVGEAAGSEICWCDYRKLEERPFDKIASVGMCEHVGKKRIGEYFRRAYDLLAPGGLFLNHGITRSAGSPPAKKSFIDRYVFPDGELLTLSEMVQAAEDAGFEVRDVEGLREHYEETLRHWVQALCEREDEAMAVTDARTFRIWKLYMSGSAEAFRRGDIAIHQMLLSKGDDGRSGAARPRERWYRDW